MRTNSKFNRGFLGTLMAAAFAALALSSPAYAGKPSRSVERPKVVGYDITNAAMSGFGGYAHYYTGNIQPLQTIDVFDNPATLANYTLGQGTMNDALLALDDQHTQLFATLASDGTPINPTITIYFDKPYMLSDMSLYAFPRYGNLQVNNLTGLTVTAGGATFAFSTSIIGSDHETAYVNFAGTPIANAYVDRLTLSNFTTDAIRDPNGRFAFAVSEIYFSGASSTTTATHGHR